MITYLKSKQMYKIIISKNILITINKQNKIGEMHKNLSIQCEVTI